MQTYGVLNAWNTVINASEYNTKYRKTNKIKQIMKVQRMAIRTLFPESLTKK